MILPYTERIINVYHRITLTNGYKLMYERRNICLMVCEEAAVLAGRGTGEDIPAVVSP
jgi:hypothetical protein